MKAFTAALDDAMARINADPDAAAKVWLDAEHPKISDAEAKKIVRDPETKWTTAPQNIFAFYQYMYKVGIVTAKAASWKDPFFPSMNLAFWELDENAMNNLAFGAFLVA